MTVAGRGSSGVALLKSSESGVFARFFFPKRLSGKVGGLDS